MRSAEGRRDEVRVIVLRAGAFETHGVRANSGGAGACRRRQNGGRVDSTGQKDADRNVGDQVSGDAVLHRGVDAFAQLALAARTAVSRVDGVHVGKGLLLTPAVDRPAHPCAGRDRLDARNPCERRRDASPGQIPEHRCRIDRTIDEARQDECPNLARERNRLVADCGVQRFDAESIAREQERPLDAVPERQREHAAHARQSGRTFSGEQPQQHFGVARRCEPVAAFLELAAQLPVVVDLSVEHDSIPRVRRRHRLRAIGRRIDDGEPPVREHDVVRRRYPHAFAVGSAMRER